MRWPRWVPVEPYGALMLATVALATVLPSSGAAASAVSMATTVGVGLLFFLYGARISPAATRAGANHWRLHLLVLLCTFAVFPLLGLAARPLESAVTPTLYQACCSYAPHHPLCSPRSR